MKKRLQIGFVAKCLPALLLLAPATAFSAAASPSSSAWQLRDAAGHAHSAPEWKDSRAVVLFFVGTDCPLANGYVPEMNRIRDAYASRDVAVYAVVADPEAQAAEIAQYAKDYRYEFSILLDPQHILVRLTGATVTPEAAVLSPDGKLLYLGRIDNRTESFGQTRFQVTEPDLRNALDDVLAGRPVREPVTKTIGCAIGPAK